MSYLIETYSKAYELTAIALQMSTKTVARIVREFSNNDGYMYSMTEVMLAGGKLAVFSTHKSTREIKRDVFLVSLVTQIYRNIQEQLNVGVTVESLRHTLIKDFGYAWKAIGIAYTTKSIVPD